jgi:hypothetical protein
MIQNILDVHMSFAFPQKNQYGPSVKATMQCSLDGGNVTLNLDIARIPEKSAVYKSSG